MTTTYPKTSKLSIKLFSYLSAHPLLTDIAKVTEMHPASDVDFKGAKGNGAGDRIKAHVVMQELNNLNAGRFTTHRISSPAFQLATYHPRLSRCQQVSELVSDAIEGASCTDFSMDGQRVEWIQLDSLISPRWGEQASLYVAACVYRFNLWRNP